MLGNGTSTNPYQITTDADLRSISNPTAYYKLMNDITMTTTPFLPRGGNTTGNWQFQGSLDGNSKKIINLIQNVTLPRTGLFDYIASPAHIFDLGFENISITSNSGEVAVFGHVNGSDATTTTIERCWATGTITQTGSGNSHCGGFIGIATGVTVRHCWTTCTVNYNGNTRAGGFIGEHTDSALLINCYSVNKINGSGADVAGFIGYRVGSSGITACTWDSTFAGRSYSVGAGTSSEAGMTIRTTTQMKTATPYSGWDTSIWSFVAGVYPQFKAIKVATAIVTSFVNHVQGLTGFIKKRNLTLSSFVKSIQSVTGRIRKKDKSVTSYMSPISSVATWLYRNVHAATVTVLSHVYWINAESSRAAVWIRQVTSWAKPIHGAVLAARFFVKHESRVVTSWFKKVINLSHSSDLRARGGHGYLSHTENQIQIKIIINNVNLSPMIKLSDVEVHE